MFANRVLSLCLSIRSFFRLLPTCERYTSTVNEPISMQIGIRLTPEGAIKGMNGQRRGQEVK